MRTEESNSPDPERSSAAAEEQPGTAAGRVRRAIAWIAGNRIKTGLVVCAFLVSAGGVVVLWLALASAGGGEARHVTLEAALAELDSGVYGKARNLAGILRKQKTLPPEELGGPVFVLGAATAYEAREIGPKERSHHYLLAAGYLEDARDRGFPPGRKAEGLFLLGESLFHSGQIPASRPVLAEALQLDRGHQSEIEDLLAAACLRDANPKLAEALEHNGRYLANRLLSRSERERGLLRQAEILLQMGNLAECRKVLAGIPPQASNYPGATVLRGQVLMHEARQLTAGAEVSAEARLEARTRYEEAIKTLRTGQGRDTLSTQATRKAQYLMGVCFLQLGNYRAAVAQFKRTRTMYADTPEAVAASFHEAELARQLGHDAEALTGYRQVLSSVTNPKDYSNPWISLDQLRKRSADAYRHYMETENYAVALQLVRQFHPVFPLAKKIEWTAEAHHRWGRALMTASEGLAADESEPMRRQARTQFRRAGRDYEKLASLETTTRRYTDHLWSSADNYLAGHAYRDALKVLREYLKNETRRRHSRALVNLGEALLALDRVDDALATLRDCVDFHPRDAAAFRARLLASRAHVEKGEIAKAEDLLEDNLNGVLSPTSKEWRESLFALGHLLYIDGRYEKAIARLDEAVHRYPESPKTIEARYLIADAYRRGAEASRERLDTSPVRNARLTWTRHIHESLGKALAQYKLIQETLNQRQQVGTLTSQEKSILRNADFAAGEVRFELGRYEEAVHAYLTAAYRYQSDPAALLAYQQIANAYRRMNKPIEARKALRQAKVVLGRIKPDVSFDKTTPFDRKEWEQLFDEQLDGLRAAGRRTPGDLEGSCNWKPIYWPT